MNKNKIAVVKFSDSITLYDFFCENNIEKGDTVVCDTSRGYSVGHVMRTKETSHKATAWIIQKVDVEAHRRRLELHAKREAILAEMKRRKEVLEQEAIFKMMAEKDDTMRDLLKELNDLESEI